MDRKVPLPRPGPIPEQSENRLMSGAQEVRESAPMVWNEDIASILMSHPMTGPAPNVAGEGVAAFREEPDAVWGDKRSYDSDVLGLVRRGLPFAALENLVDAVGMPQKEVASVVGIPPTTLGRRRKSGRLTPIESDHIVRVARLVVMARNMMAGDVAAAGRWLTTPHRLLGDESPLRRASTETGGREVEQLIGQLRHGVFS